MLYTYIAPGGSISFKSSVHYFTGNIEDKSWQRNWRMMTSLISFAIVASWLTVNLLLASNAIYN